MISRKLVLAVAGLSLMAGSAFAQDWPSKPVTMIVPYNPGGTTDILARLAADAIAAAIGQPVVIENKPGAGGVVGATLAAGAPNDGYTIFFGNNATNVVQPVINPAVSYSATDSFDGIATTADSLVFIGVNADTRAADLASFVEYLKENNVKYGSAGIGSMGQFSTEYFLQQTGTTATHIPYAGSNDAVTAILSGEIGFMADPAVTRQIDNDMMNVIAALSDDRHPAYPDVPTAKEQGFDVSIVGWFGVFAPAGTDPAIIAQMSAPLEDLLASESYQQQVLTMGLLPMYRDPAATDAVVESDLEIFVNIRDAAGISIN
ncbi:Bug family tripartite tricarboxylate transporter substrate binding protein [Roseinatronobacter alkalisoli]|uniref:Tripartite tricarboxylate transporter substrate binding protein n=1 Tax=Roseinatronobacter alkalisoli TaxID=3028235 RepID=A0ABT5TDA8_9RHOB|nr:tripartite tricarboxylate transporter substrate binding protein [Roseinatronobacter sp. HJB301]MDD7973103.1 tripartite tricarboxylate transporter substrate binding protein [Roseinatronobacter sp. HJB301]